jgi:hypothetical protein
MCIFGTRSKGCQPTPITDFVHNAVTSPDSKEQPTKWDPVADKEEFLRAIADAPKAYGLDRTELVDASFIWADMEAGSWMPLCEVPKEG